MMLKILAKKASQWFSIFFSSREQSKFAQDEVVFSSVEQAWSIHPADLRHHCDYWATIRLADGRSTPTPTEVVRFFCAPLSYLEQFTEGSVYHADVENFKLELAH